MEASLFDYKYIFPLLLQDKRFRTFGASPAEATVHIFVSVRQLKIR